MADLYTVHTTWRYPEREVVCWLSTDPTDAEAVEPEKLAQCSVLVRFVTDDAPGYHTCEAELVDIDGPTEGVGRWFDRHREQLVGLHNVRW